MMNGPFDLGVEEEYQVVDPESWELRSRIQSLMAGGPRSGANEVRAEFLQSQIEAVSRVCDAVQELRAEIRRMRQEVYALTDASRLAVVAAGTHPFSSWVDQRVTDGDRYEALAEELQEVGRRLVTFGLHIHIGIADADLRIQLLSRLRPYLPLLLALSVSSPFFGGRSTGLMSYRAALLAALPRTGIPPTFASWSEYAEVVDRLIRAEMLADPSTIWWDLRPSARFPTLEVRIADMPTRVDETICLAAWVQALAVKLAREPETVRTHRLVVEVNRWQATRYGLGARLLLPGRRTARKVGECVEVLLDWLGDVAEELGSVEELNYARTIVSQGASSDRQLRVWRKESDLRAVMAHLARETMA
jgi:carboxylate-amine ligase